MRKNHISRGLDLPINGKPATDSIERKQASSVALIGFDYHGMKPTLVIAAGDRVKRGQPLFTDKKTEGVVYTSPAGGKVVAINRGYQRSLQSVVIVPDANEEAMTFPVSDIDTMPADQVREVMVNSGMWTALRTRPFSKVPAPSSEPFALFVNAMDTNPLAVDPQLVIGRRSDDYINGLKVLSRLVSCDIHVCAAESAQIVQPDMSRIHYHQFSGKHPAGNVGTHMHYIAPVGSQRVNWHLHYQDVIAIGALFTTGTLDVSRIISLAGPQVAHPKLIETRVGADVESMCAGECREGDNRIISGSVLSGRRAADAVGWLGRYHLQVSVIKEGHQRFLLHYMSPGLKRFSVLNIYLSKLFPKAGYDFTSSTNGSERAMVPIGAYERVMPLDILPTQLLRSLLVKDIQMAVELGCLEFDEEDLSLCTFVCPGKYEYGPILRDNLALIEKEGL